MSLFDDFQESAQPPAYLNPTFPSADAERQAVEGQRQLSGVEQKKARKSKKLESSYVASESKNRALADLFSLQYVQFQLPAVLVSMAVQNNILAAVLDNFTILRINLDDPLHIDVVEIPRKAAGNKVSDLFLDPTGRHIIVTTQTGENYYLFHRWGKPRELAKLRGILITCVAWNKLAAYSSTSTRHILIGSDKGIVYETMLEPTVEDTIFKDSIERYVIQLYDSAHTASSENDKIPITGLQIENFPADRSRYLIMIATPTRLYQFNGVIAEAATSNKAFFEPIIDQETPEQCLVLPSSLSYSHIVFFNPFPELQLKGVPQHFAWLTGAGVFCGHLDFTGGPTTEAQQSYDMITEANLIPLPPTNYDDTSDRLVTDTPINLCLTEFHLILLYTDHVRAVCRLTDKVVFQENIPLQEPDEIVEGMAVDDMQRTYWIYTTAAMYELVIKNESRDMWKFYLQKKQYEKALQFATTSAQRTQIYEAKAQNDFDQKKYMESARYYAKVSSNRFEEIALKFLQKGEKAALQYLLTERLAMMKQADGTANEQKTQKTIIATWLLKLKLSDLNKEEEMAASVSFTSMESLKAAGTQQQLSMHSIKERPTAREELCQFLKNNRMDLHRATTYRMLLKQGFSDAELYLYYAYLAGDIDKMITHWINERNWSKAIDILDEQGDLDLIYKYSSMLLENEPKKTVDMWIRHENINPKSLVPAILCYQNKRSDRTAQRECIRYLTHILSTFENTDAVIHNLLLTIYARHTKDETAILTFLNNEGRGRHYDLQYALRLCKENNLYQSCIQLYSQMGFHENAVDLALKHNNLELAMMYADKAEENDTQRKKLWIRIARHIIQVEKNMKTAIGLLKQGDLLRMEDILPFFPDNLPLDDFKDEICAALEEYNVGIEDLRQEMDNATISAKHIRSDIRALRKRFNVVKEEQYCCLCRFPLLTRQFYVFSCKHQFHADCLHSRISKYLPTRFIKQLADLQQSISEEYRKLVECMDPVKDRAGIIARIDSLRHQFDDIVARQCFMCGDVMIESIHVPFVAEEEADSWVI